MDYILPSDPDLLSSYCIFQKHHFNVSPHVHVHENIQLSISNYQMAEGSHKDSSASKLKQKPNTVYSCNKINSDEFIEHLQTNLYKQLLQMFIML